MANDGQPPVCGLDGNPDLTGLGLRTAFYIQSITFAVAGEFLDAEAAFLHSSAMGLLLAILVALVRETIMGSLRAPEVAVIMWLFSIQVVASSRTTKKFLPVPGQPVPTESLVRLRVQYAFVFAFVGYATWFWFRGLDTLPRTACVEYGFFFAKVDVRGWFRTLNKVVWGIVCGVFGLYICFLIIVWCIYMFQKTYAALRGRTQCNAAPVPDRLDNDDVALYNSFFPESRANLPAVIQHLPPVKRVAVSSTVLAASAMRATFFLSLMVPSVELQIHWNEIRGVQSLDSVGQLVPLIMALGQFVHVVYSMIRGKDYVDYRIRKKATDLGKPPACPKRGVPLDQEQHELIESIEDPESAEAVVARESIDTRLTAD